MRNFLTLGLFAGILALASGCRDLIDSFGDDEAPTCEATSECGEGQVCNAGHCGAPGTVAQGRPCWASRDCQEGLYCSPLGVCAEAGTGAIGDDCSDDSACGTGLRCELVGFSGSCQTAGTGEPGATCAGNGDCLGGLYCSPDGVCKSLFDAYPPFLGITCTPPATGEAFRGYFEVPRPGAPPLDFYRLPFPNDARVSATGELDMSDFPRPGPTPLGIDLVQLYVDSLVADFEGFGATSVVSFRFAGNLDFDSTSGDTIKLVDVTPGPSAGQGLGLGWSYSSGRTKYSCESRLSVRPSIASPLRPNHTYAVYLTNGLKAEDGVTAAVADTDFTAVLAATRPTGDDALARAWDAYQPLRDHFTAEAIDPATIVNAAVFTVQDTTGHMDRLATSVAAQPAPVLTAVTLCDTGVTSPCDDGTPARACPAASPDFYEIHGKISVPIYQAGTPPYLTPDQGGGIAEDGSGVPQLVRSEDVCFALTIPKVAVMPGSGWPLVVYSHGTGGSMRSFINDGVATQMATSTTPAAVFGFDAVEHGARRGGSDEDPDNLVFNALNPRAARDNLLQGAADILQVFRIADLASFMVGGPGAVDFDAARVAFFGHSQGSSSGELALAFSDAAPAAVFSGAGAFLTTSLLEKTSPVNIKAGMSFLMGDEFNGEHPVMTLFQTYFERSDAVNYVPLIVRSPPAGIASKHVLMSYGSGDTFTPRGTMQHNGRGLGVPGVMPVPPDEEYSSAAVSRPVTANMTGGDNVARTAACFFYAPDGYDGHFVTQNNPAAVADWTAFLRSFFATGTPSVP